VARRERKLAADRIGAVGATVFIGCKDAAAAPLLLLLRRHTRSKIAETRSEAVTLLHVFNNLAT